MSAIPADVTEPGAERACMVDAARAAVSEVLGTAIGIHNSAFVNECSHSRESRAISLALT